jgi:hypothetical protein
MAKALLARARGAGFQSVQSAVGSSERASLPPSSSLNPRMSRAVS